MSVVAHTSLTTVLTRFFQSWKGLVALVAIVVPLNAWAQQEVAIPRNPAAPMQVYDVTSYGAVPNDGKNDTTSIRNAINDANNAGGGTVYFPHGIYHVSNLPLKSTKRQDQEVASLDRPLRNVVLTGEGAEGPKATILQRLRGKSPDQRRVAIMADAQDILLKDIVFDANGIQRYGGFAFYGCKRITITHTRFFDSNPFPYAPVRDRYAYVFGYGGASHEDLVIRHNRIEDLALEINFAKRVQITGNTLIRSDFTGAIGSYALGSGKAFEEVKIIGNTIIDAAKQAITVQLDFRPPKAVNNFRFRNIEIRDNVIIYTPKIRKAPGLVMRIGASNNSNATTGNTFENIRIEGNSIYIEPGTPPFSAPMIFGNTSSTANFKFVNLIVKQNNFYYNGEQPLVDIRRLSGDSVEQSNNRQLPYQPPPERLLKP